MSEQTVIRLPRKRLGEVDSDYPIRLRQWVNDRAWMNPPADQQPAGTEHDAGICKTSVIGGVR